MLVLGDIWDSNFTGFHQLFCLLFVHRIYTAKSILQTTFWKVLLVAMLQNQDEYIAFLSIKVSNIGFLFIILQLAKHQRINYRHSVHNSAKSLFKT